MLQFRREQLELLRGEALGALARELVPHVREHFRDHTVERTDSELEAQVEQVLGLALAEGVGRPGDLHRFVNLAMALGVDWVLEAWRQTSRGDPSERLSRICKRAMFELEMREAH